MFGDRCPMPDGLILDHLIYLVVGCSMTDVGCPMWVDPRSFDLVKLSCLMLDVGCPMWVDPRSFDLVKLGCLMLDVRCRMPDVG
jgi:hypothetical protein